MKWSNFVFLSVLWELILYSCKTVIGALNCLVQIFTTLEFGVVGVFLQKALAVDNLTYKGLMELEKVDDYVERGGLEAQGHPIENPFFFFLSLFVFCFSWPSRVLGCFVTTWSSFYPIEHASVEGTSFSYPTYVIGQVWSILAMIM